MRKLINATWASLFVVAVLVAAPAYTDFIDNPNPVVGDTQGATVPDVMGSW